MGEIEDFKYEFDLSYTHYINENYIPQILINGYMCLHQFIKQDFTKIIDECNVIWAINSELEDGETINKLGDGKYEIKVNNLSYEILEYVRFLLKYSMIKTKNLRIEDNVIKFEIDYEDTYQRKQT